MLNFILKKLSGKKQETDATSENPAAKNSEVHSVSAFKELPYEELPEIVEGQLDIHSTNISPADRALIVGFFISNGMEKKIAFETLPLVLMDKEKRAVARQSFDGGAIGEIAPGTAKACVVRFTPDHFLTQEIPLDAQVYFDIPANAQLASQTPQASPVHDLPRLEFQSWPQGTTEEAREELERVLKSLPPLRFGEINLAPLQAQLTEVGELLATVMIRNATNRTINLAQLPLAILDAQHLEVARGVFDIADLILEPFKVLVWSFNFGLVPQVQELDLSSWYINLVQMEEVVTTAQDSSRDLERSEGLD